MTIIRSILEQDLYKFNMCANVLRHHPGTRVRYEFTHREPKATFHQSFYKALQQELEGMASLKATEEELHFLQKACPYLPPQFLDFIQNYRYDPSQLDFDLKDGQLTWSCEGNWETAIMWEVPTLALISELYYIHCVPEWSGKRWKSGVTKRTKDKASEMKACVLAEFGLRRRRSYDVQDLVIQTLQKHHPRFVGTSNVHFAHKYNLTPIGTMAHELVMAYSVLESLRHANRFVLRDWAETFQGKVGIALTDTYGSDAFFADFDEYWSRLYDGIRHDSGDPFAFGERTIQHYEAIGIDPASKTLVFSDGLNATLAAKLEAHFRDRIRVVFGIGTNLTNDIPSSNPLNIVIKMTECDGVPVVKLSDVPGKESGDPEALRVARWTFRNQPLDAS
ncbi:MAG: nicotinate phosphoribosyltransferase [Deltaproteobacteria bacterium]|nr:MAG: nicotinate phosphoribosyltransferase [Deltaproteobacteria bacterium]